MYTQKLLVACFIVLSFSGCGNTASKDSAANSSAHAASSPISEEDAQLQAQTQTPEAAVDLFIGAVYRQDIKKSMSLLTPRARLVFAKDYGMPFSPPASKNAEYKIVKVTKNGENGAFVESVLTDFSADDKPIVDPPIIWAVAKTADGWRIAGAALQQFQGLSAIVLNFEDKAELDKGIADAIRQAEEYQAANNKNAAE